MKNKKVISIIFSLVFALSALCLVFAFYSSPISSINNAYGDTLTYSKKYRDDADKQRSYITDTAEPMHTTSEMGNIPFSLFTSQVIDPGSVSTHYNITDYVLSFDEITPSNSTTGVYEYRISNSSIPYIMLSSTESSNKQLYNTTLFFKFNDQNLKTNYSGSGTIPTDDAGFIQVDAFLNDENNKLLVDIDTSASADVNTGDASVVFSVNLKNGNQPSFIDGSVVNINQRTGLYSFKITHSCKTANQSKILNKCIFYIEFYVLDYASYTLESSPLKISNANELVDTNCYSYNYNQVSGAPIVEFDITKFSPNFVFDMQKTNYNSNKEDISNEILEFEYASLRYEDNAEPRDVASLPLNSKTATITMKLKNSQLEYTIPTYKVSNTLPYYAKLDMKDFETNFLVKYGKSSSFLGEYIFNLNYMVANNDGGYKVVDKKFVENDRTDTSADSLSFATTKKLVIFGFDLKYNQRSVSNNITDNKYVSLKNDVVDASVLAGRVFYSGSFHRYAFDKKNAVTMIPVTNQTPLKFDCYGNLNGSALGMSSLSSPFARIDNSQEDKVVEFLNSNFNLDIRSGEGGKFLYIGDLSGENKISLDNTYTEGNSISGDGIRIMYLEYYVNVDTIKKIEVDESTTIYTSSPNEKIVGFQVVAFKIDNTIQNLKIQGVDYNTQKTKVENLYDFEQYTSKNVRVSIETKPNTFFAPIEVSYYHYPNYGTTGSYNYGVLSKKVVDGNVATYCIKEKIGEAEGPGGTEDIFAEKNYNYFVRDNGDLFTFKNSGTYKVLIRNTISNSSVAYFFTIDNEGFNNVELHNVSYNSGSPVVDINSTLKTTSFTGSSNYIKTNLVSTNAPFTLGWDNKASGAKSYSYVYYMETTHDTSIEDCLLKVNTTDYWLTNGSKLSSPSGAINSYENYKNTIDPAEKNYEVSSNNFFSKDGLYFFYVFDEAGNFFTRIVLVDTSLNSILQGYWNGTWENGTWVSTFDPNNNPANFVNRDTTIYFGTHKAVSLPNLDTKAEISFEDKSFTRKYSLDSNEYKIVGEKPPISFDLYKDIISQLSNYVKQTDIDNNILIKTHNDATFSKYFIVLKNTQLEYKKEYEEGVDENGAPLVKTPTTGKITNIAYARIYVTNDTSVYNFNGEAQYFFTISNENGSKALSKICMNFDMIQGKFYAYGNSDGDMQERYIRKNSGTNLNVLMFEYNVLSNESAQYYALKELDFEYYGFVVDEDSSLSSKNAYPFSKTLTDSGSLLDLQESTGDGKTIVVDGINTSADITKPGKYVITRTYVGGTHNFKNGIEKTEENLRNAENYVEVGTGGKYYKHVDEFENITFVDLFEFGDSITRKYVVYVDHNGIVTTTYMQREIPVFDEDEKEILVRTVGDNISISLSSNQDDEWNFKEFFLTSSSTLTLNTNKTPIQINIPLSKYFAYYYAHDNSRYAEHAFAQLEITIHYAMSTKSAWKNYVIDGYDIDTGYCTCKDLVSSSNPNGYLIFIKEGIYIISINDSTGYMDNSSFNINSNNIDPTIFFENKDNDFNGYKFSIVHTSPEATIETNVYNSVKGDFEKNTLEIFEVSNTFATNIKKSNDDEIDDNEVLFVFSDELTPYNAKINQVNINITKRDENLNKTVNIDLKSFDLLNLARTHEYISNENILDFGYINYFSIDFYDDEKPLIYDQKNYYRFRYSISLDITKEYTYKITISYVSSSSTNQSYIDENGVDFSTSIYTLSIDRTKPNTNINNLLYAEEFLTNNYYTEENLFNFKEELFDISKLEDIPSAFTYTFAIPDNYSLQYNSSETLSYFFVRNYSKYDSEYSSITPDMVESVYENDKTYYSNDNYFSINYPRFSEINTPNDKIISGNQTWYKILYKNNTSLKSLIANATKESSPKGFYEIIERDLAGNYRCYTVYFNEYNRIYQNLEIDGLTSKDGTTFLISKGQDATKDNINSETFVEISKLTSHLGWGKISITNATTNIKYDVDILINPYKTIVQVDNELTDLNEFLDCKINSKFAFTLSKYNSTYNEKALTRYINLIVEGEGKLDKPQIETITSSSGNVSYNLILPNYTTRSVLYLEKFSLQKRENNRWKLLEYNYEDKDSIPSKIEGLGKGIYKAIYKDNFNSNEYYYTLYVGEYYINDFEKEYQFEFSKYLRDVSREHYYYSGGTITITYESNIYKVSVSNGINEKQVSGTNLEQDSQLFNNCKTFQLTSNYSYDNISASKYVGGLTYYRVTYRDIIDDSIQKTYYFNIYNELPSIYLTNSDDNEIVSTLQPSETDVASSVVTIDWDKLTSLSYNELNEENNNNITDATIYTRNKNGEYRNGNTIHKGQTIADEGYYKLVVKNSKLGNYREIYFAISFTEIPLYTVMASGKTLQSSNTKNFETFDLVKTGLISTIRDQIENKLSFANENERISLTKQLNTNGICDLNDIKHFYCVTNPTIKYNNNIELKKIEFCFVNDELDKDFGAYIVSKDQINTYNFGSNFMTTPLSTNNTYLTTIVLVYNFDGPIKMEFFAITKVPESHTLLGDAISYVNTKGTTTFIDLSSNSTALTNANIANSTVTIIWNALQNDLTTSEINWYNCGNVILVDDTDDYGHNTSNQDLEFSYYSDKKYLTVTLSGSGAHNLTFSDLAGNVHQFISTTSPTSYSIILIDSVIYHINYNDIDCKPIQYAMFNDELNLIIDDKYMSLYSNLNVAVTRNGNAYYDYELENNKYTFKKSGRYVVTITASYAKMSNALNNATYIFNIIDSNSARLAFEFVEVSGYEIVSVKRNGLDITNNFVDENGKIYSLFISSTSSNSGNGNYNVVLKYGKNSSDTIGIDFIINDYIPSISCNVDYGGTTTGSIKVSYNPSVIYEQLGDCYIKVLTYNSDSNSFYNYATFEINSSTFVNNSARSFELTKSNSYFVQVETKSGNILSSFRVNKTDPLNTMAIIIIVIAVITGIILIIVVIKLRTRMKIK